MPLVQINNSPAYDRLRGEGQFILRDDQAEKQDIRTLHIGVLNLMQDGALYATERQFLRLLGKSSQIAQVKVHLSTLPELPLGAEKQAHVDAYYEDFQAIKERGLDALIITGRNVQMPDISQEDFYPGLCAAIDWARENVPSTILACAAAHGYMKYVHGSKRTRLNPRPWGLYKHRKVMPAHPLLHGVNTQFYVPHARRNTISPEEFEKAGCHILSQSIPKQSRGEDGVLYDGPDVGVHIATSPDGFRFIMAQGHIEYDTHSLLKEYKREVLNFFAGLRPDYPENMDNYFSPQSWAIIKEYRQMAFAAQKAGRPLPDFPEKLLEERLFNNWQDSGKSFMSNWIGAIYRTTNFDRKKQYMEDVDPNNPLGIDCD